MLDGEDFTFRFDVGVTQPSRQLKFSDREGIVQSFSNYFVIVKAKASIDQIADGLSAMGVYQMMKANPHAIRKLLMDQPVLNADYLVKVFQPRLSPLGSNSREDEELLVMYWVNLIEMIEGRFHYNGGGVAHKHQPSIYICLLNRQKIPPIQLKLHELLTQ